MKLVKPVPQLFLIKLALGRIHLQITLLVPTRYTPYDHEQLMALLANIDCNLLLELSTLTLCATRAKIIVLKLIRSKSRCLIPASRHNGYRERDSDIISSFGKLLHVGLDVGPQISILEIT